MHGPGLGHDSNSRGRCANRELHACESQDHVTLIQSQNTFAQRLANPETAETSRIKEQHLSIPFQPQQQSQQ